MFVQTQFRAFNRAMIDSCEYLHALQVLNYVLCIVAAKRSRIEAISPISVDEPFGLFFDTTPIGMGSIKYSLPCRLTPIYEVILAVGFHKPEGPVGEGVIC